MRVARIHGLTGERVDCAPTVEIAEPDRAVGQWPRKLVDAEIDELLAHNDPLEAMPVVFVRAAAALVSRSPSSVADELVTRWMESAGHRANLLDPRFDALGVGVTFDGFRYAATQNFR